MFPMACGEGGIEIAAMRGDNSICVESCTRGGEWKSGYTREQGTLRHVQIPLEKD